MPRTVQIGPPQFEPLHFAAAEVEALFHWLDQQSEFSIPPGDLSIAFLDEKALAQVHADFLGDPSPTDVITFPGDPAEDFAGEILVSAERALAEAPKYGHCLARELTLYLVHGWLHLAGLDDIEEEDRKAMRAAEEKLMQSAESAGKVPEFKS